ncbi:metallopeptidase TldD-related protein [Streptomyces sp. L7]
MSPRTNKPHEIVERALELSRADGCVVIADEHSTANLRWAGNALTTNGVTRGRTLTVIATVDGKEGTASGVVSRSAVTPEELEPLVRAAEAAARGAEPAEDAQPLVTGVAASPDFTDGPAETSSSVFTDFAPALGESFARARAGGRELYGFANHELVTSYLGTSTGLRLRHDQPNGTLELNAKSPDRTRSAWAGRSTRDFKDVDPAALDAELAVRLGWAERKIELPAGRYETLLPPTAVADLLIYQMWSASGRDAVEGRTVFSKPGGGTRVGEKLTELPLTLRSDPNEPGLESAPFVLAHTSGGDQSVFDNGLPLTATDWVREGELQHLLTSRHSAGLTEAAGGAVDRQPDPQRGRGPLPGGDGREHRTRTAAHLSLVHPRGRPGDAAAHGLTRDGVYLVENGEVAGEVNNFRFNESPVDLLRAGDRGGADGKDAAEGMERPGSLGLRCPRCGCRTSRMSSVSQGV